MPNMSWLVDRYAEFEAQSEAFGDSADLRAVAERLAAELPCGPLTLLARTDGALMCCAAVAMLREHPTRVERAHLGRRGWTPSPELILVEPVRPTAGLLATLQHELPGMGMVILDGLLRRGPVAA